MATKKATKNKKPTLQAMMPAVNRPIRDKEELRSLINQQIARGEKLIEQYPQEMRNMFGVVTITKEIEQSFLNDYNIWQKECENIYKQSFEFAETPYLRQFRGDDIPWTCIFRNEVGEQYTEYLLILARQIGQLRSFLRQIDNL